MDPLQGLVNYINLTLQMNMTPIVSADGFGMECCHIAQNSP